MVVVVDDARGEKWIDETTHQGTTFHIYLEPSSHTFVLSLVKPLLPLFIP
jgi:hypothetical protein